MSELTQYVEVFDTTLRDGLQVEGVSATVDDKLRIAEQLDYLGVHFIEGGWPGANPKDIEFFARAETELQLTTSTFVAFGSTRRPRGKVDEDQTLQHLLDAHTERGVHRRQELRLPRHPGAADDARGGRGDDRRLGRVPARATAGWCSSTWSTSSTASRRTPSSRSGRSRRRW